MPDHPPSVNAPSAPLSPPERALLARNKSLEAWALAEALADALTALPPGAVDEKAIELDNQLPYRDEMKAYLRGVEPDRLR